MIDLAKHVIDIDIYHTNEDRPAYNHGLFWHTDHYSDAATATHRSYSQAIMAARGLQDYGGGPSKSTTIRLGSAYYYFTGDPLAREAVLGFSQVGDQHGCWLASSARASTVGQLASAARR
jgi:hypothetical protein